MCMFLPTLAYLNQYVEICTARWTWYPDGDPVWVRVSSRDVASPELVWEIPHARHHLRCRKGIWSQSVIDLVSLLSTCHSSSNPFRDIAKACEEGGHETASHCYRWIDYTHMDAESEEKLIRKAVESFKKTSPTGKVPVGWYYGRPSPRSRALVSKVYRELNLELLYQADTCKYHNRLFTLCMLIPAKDADDLPYWLPDPAGSNDGLLMVPYSYDCNDFKFFVAPGFGSSMAYFEHAKNAFGTSPITCPSLHICIYVHF